MLNEPIEPLSPQQDSLATFDALNLWRVEIITDTKAGDIKMLTPITDKNVRDTERRVRYFSEVVVGYAGRPFKVPFEIEAISLAEACLKFHDAGRAAGEKILSELQSQSLRSRIMGTTEPRPN